MRNITELARYLGVTTQCIRDWVRKKKIPAADLHVGGKSFWSSEAAGKAMEYRMMRFPSTQREQRRITKR